MTLYLCFSDASFLQAKAVLHPPPQVIVIVSSFLCDLHSNEYEFDVNIFWGEHSRYFFIVLCTLSIKLHWMVK